VGVDNNDQQFVFYTASDGTIRGQHYNLISWIGTNLGYTASSAPSAAVNPTTDEQFVSFAGGDGQIHVAHYNGGGWVVTHLGYEIY
jgi:hypothetical protein